MAKMFYTLEEAVHAVNALEAEGFAADDITLVLAPDVGLVDMADITYKLVADTYADTMDISEANALFPAGETAVTHTSGVSAMARTAPCSASIRPPKSGVSARP